MEGRHDARMVDVGQKPISARSATAEGWIALNAEALAAVVERSAKKGDVLTIAQIAGIGGAKRTSELIPLCHPLPLSGVDVHFTIDADEGQIHCVATARTHGRTGVEMEALSAVSAALLTIYDMLKAVDRAMEIGAIRLREKKGGRSGHWQREHT